ncbi:hypothetical protein TRVA0_067S00188 [Trichomonascus vanleenenianus]|uniref:uncharacterized protein n=1 Tax=Trichomonascus vanleenenianus TaxID=2268995 RepID=UPI003ECB6CE8
MPTVLKVLICGGGCAGPALANFLANAGHDVTIVERFPALRAAGAQIDVRDQGIEVLKRMGVLDAVREKCVKEEGMTLIDNKNNSKGTILANKSGGAQGPTSEYEIMRGNLVRVLYDSTKDRVNYIFGKTVERFEQDESKVTAYFSDGTRDTYDLLVGADGQGSRIRKAIRPEYAPSPYRRLGVYSAYWIIPRIASDDNFWRVLHVPGRRVVFRRSPSATESYASCLWIDDSEELRSLSRATIEQQKEYVASKIKDVGWEASRFRKELATTEDFYFHELVQVKIDSFSKGRVVLLGDAGYCPATLTGMGTTGCFVGAYVLAGEINRNPDDFSQALANYEKVMRPFVDEIQKLEMFWVRALVPETQWGISVLHFIFGLMCLLRIPQLLLWLAGESRGDWKLPEY